MDKFRVTALRKDAGLTQALWAERLGVSPSYIGDLERGHRRVSLKLAERLEKATGLPIVDEFLAARKNEAA